MARVFVVFSVLAASGCISHPRENPEEAEAEMQADIDREVASCRCVFGTSVGDTYDVPCGTTYCLGRIPVRCGLDAVPVQLDSECDSYDENELLAGLCRQTYPGTYPVDCSTIPDESECESHGGCTFEAAPCTEATFGCEGFVTDQP